MKHWKIYLSILALVALSALPAHAITLELIGPGAGFQDVSENGTKVLLFTFYDGRAYLWTFQERLTHIGTSNPGYCAGGTTGIASTLYD